ncbi:MAG: carbonic anhydrase family protein [Spirochaetia bacterium]|nr:carbonic anhydrase family protein [Spirochaetia bacterium]
MRNPCIVFLLSVTLITCQKIQGLTESHWGYEKPDAWEGICNAGRLQSPIDIQRTTRASIDELKFDYSELPLKVSNNGHTVQVDAAGTGGMSIGETRFNLIQYHFHIRSEHAIKGATSDMEVHFVHKDASGNIAVVGVLLKKGEMNPLFKTILDMAPKEKGEKGGGAMGNPGEFMPLNKGYYTYVGSLTTPDCREGLKWIVMKQPVEISDSQIKAFRDLFKSNARPVQALNNRIVLESE